MNDFILDQQLTPIDITDGTGPDYTYHHISLNHKSYIDHILASNNILNKITNTGVTPQHYLNTGDHLPVMCEMITETTNDSTTHPTNQPYHVPNFIWNNKTFLNNYNLLLEQSVNRFLEYQDIDKEISTLHQTLRDCAIQAYTDLKRDSDFHFVNTKRWWNTDLSKKRKILQQ